MRIPTNAIGRDLHAVFFGLVPHHFDFSHSLALERTLVNVAKMHENHHVSRVAMRSTVVMACRSALTFGGVFRPQRARVSVVRAHHSQELVLLAYSTPNLIGCWWRTNAS